MNRWDVLPEFPWDRLAPYADRARTHREGIVDLSVGTPIDPTPAVVQNALATFTDAPGYPTTIGVPALKETCLLWSQQVLGSPVECGFLPVIGSKEIVASLPTLLGCGAGDTLVIPEIAYPTYQVGGLAAGMQVVASDVPESVPGKVAMVWLNSPSNPTGSVLSADRLTDIIRWARDNNVVIASDECYFELAWDAEPISALDHRVNDGSTDSILAVHSLSKRSNMAGYRFGFLAGDPALTQQILGIRKHLGMLVPSFVQQAAIAAYSDSDHVNIQRERYRNRRTLLQAALVKSGFEIHHSQAGLYLWATEGKDCWESVANLATLGILVTPGEFYGDQGRNFVRIALTATDEDIVAACERLGHY